MRTTATAIATRTAPTTSQRIRLQPARPCCSRYVLIPLLARWACQRFLQPRFPYAFLTLGEANRSSWFAVPCQLLWVCGDRYVGQQRGRDALDGAGSPRLVLV